jgi:outer membrane protein
MNRNLARCVSVAIVTIGMAIQGNAQDSSSSALSLKQCVEIAVTNNLQVKQSDLQMQTAEVNWKQARANMLPSINGSASHGINQGRSIDPFSNSYINQQVNYASYGVNGSLPLFNGLGIQNSIKQTSLAYEASRMDLQQNKDNLTLNVILAYLQVLSAEDQLTQARNQVAVSKQQVERLEVLNKDGAIAPSLLSDLKGTLASNELTVVNSQNNLETAKLSLCQLMNIDYKPDMRVERINADTFPVDYGMTPDKIYEISLQQLAMVKAVNLRQRSAEKAISVARGNYFPSLSLNGNLNSNYSTAARQDVFLNTTEVNTNNYVLIGSTKTPVVSPQSNFRSDKIAYGDQLNNNLYTSISLDLRIPILNAFQVRNRVKLAKIQLQNTEYIAQTTKIQLKQAIELGYVNMVSANNRYKALTDQVAAFSESFRAAEIRFNAGVGTVVDYMIAKNNVDQANINLIMARYDYLLRTKVLDYYQNKPLW